MTCEMERLRGCLALDGPGQGSFGQSLDKKQELESCQTARHKSTQGYTAQFSFPVCVLSISIECKIEHYMH